MEKYKAVLFDLDGTLLPMDTNHFIENYLKLLAGKVSHIISPETFIPNLLKSTEVMIVNNDPEKTNEQVFMEDFVPRIGEKAEELLAVIEEFYNTDFALLEKSAQSNSVASEILTILADKNIEFILATNPVFPLQAIKERMRWAGIEEFSFKLITSYENMHYCKPKVEYYQEILHKTQLSGEECLMVGNDVQEDLIAANTGMETFLVTDYLIDKSDGNYKADYKGTLEEFKNLLAKTYY